MYAIIFFFTGNRQTKVNFSKAIGYSSDRRKGGGGGGGARTTAWTADVEKTRSKSQPSSAEDGDDEGEGSAARESSDYSKRSDSES